ncbi:MAG: hypothetical protein WCQ99_06025 [Pseudomonadota bacterium]
MKTKHLVAFFMFVIMGAFFITPRYCFASLMLFDDKLRVKGSIYEFGTYLTATKKVDRQYRNDKIGLLKTKGTLELLYTAIETPDLKANMFGFFQWWHEATPDFDGDYRRSMDSRARHRYQGPYERADDWINELYADVYAGPWNIRAGKQIVFWSEVEMVRTIDRINALDLRYTTPGIDPWDEMKLGLWMLRTFYVTNLPGQLVFEGIWVPGDFQKTRTPLDGSSMGGNPGPQGPAKLRPRAYGQNAAIEDMFRRDQPAFKVANSTFAFRIRGTGDVPMFGEHYLLDWTLSWYHGMNTTPVARGKSIGYPSSFNMDKETLNGYLGNLAVSRVFGAKDIPHAVYKNFWNYKYFDAIGASCQSFIPSLKGVLRGEFSYELGLPENTAFIKEIDKSPSYSKPITGTTQRDQMNVGITFDRPLRWEWLQNQTWLASSGIIDATFGWYGQRRQGNVTHIRRTFGYYDRSQSNWSATFRANMWHNELFPVARFLYNSKNWGYGVLAVKYQPGAHMRYEGGYTWFFADNPWDAPEAYAENKDFIYLRIGYEF